MKRTEQEHLGEVYSHVYSIKPSSFRSVKEKQLSVFENECNDDSGYPLYMFIKTNNCRLSSVRFGGPDCCSTAYTVRRFPYVSTATTVELGIPYPNEFSDDTYSKPEAPIPQRAV